MTRILVIRFSSIGDIVLTSPVVRCLKQQIQKSEIHFLTKHDFSSIAKNNPYISKVYAIKNDIGEVLGKLKKEKYDYIIDLHHNLRTARVKMALLRPAASFNKLNLEKWLYVKLKINRMPDYHLVDRYMEAVKYLGVVNDGKGLDFFIPAKDEVDKSIMPEAFRQGYVGFVIGAKHATKQLPLEKIISICNSCSRPLVLLGGKEDKARAATIVKAATGHVFDACGKFNLNQSASLIRQADKIITHDTGLMHIAAAFSKEIISVWGSTVPEFGMYPYLSGAGVEGRGTGVEGRFERTSTGLSRALTAGRGTSEIVEVKGLSCRPCSKLGYKKCPQGHFKCMNEIDERVIVDFCNK